MTKLLLLFFLGVSLGSGLGEPLQPSVFRQYLYRWAEQAVEAAVAEVRETSSRLQQLVNLAENHEVQKLAKLYQENSHFIHHCNSISTADPSNILQGLPSCLNITGDIANFTFLAVYGYQLAGQVADSVDNDLKEFQSCQSLPIWSEYKCYKQAFGDIQGDIKVYSTDCNLFLSNATVVLREIEVDVKNCLSVSERFSMEQVQSAIELCKLNSKQ